MQPLSGISVLDLTVARAGPTCVRHLADWGADVIRIEPLDDNAGDFTGDRDGPDFQNLHRNKRMIRLNLKSTEGHAVFMRLVERADVFVENLRPSVKHRLKIAWDDVHPVNPRLVYGSISGFGQDGPYSQRPGVDQIVQGMGGLMSITGLPGQGPVRAGIPVADLTAGNLLALGIVMALFERAKTGLGRWVQTSLLEAQIFMLDFQATRWLMKHEVAGQAGNDHPTAIPTSVFPCNDGHINIAASSPRLWERLCDTLGCPDWKSREGWSTHEGRNSERKAINAAISEITRRQSTTHWIELFEEAGIPCGPIYAIDQVFADPQVQHLEIAAPIRHARLGDTYLVNSAINFSGAPKPVLTAAPDAGAHTAEVLRSAGYTDQDIESLRKKGVV